MFLQQIYSGDSVEIVDMSALIDPCVDSVSGRYHAGEEMQDAQNFKKADLTFQSGEALPMCWTDPDYRSKM